MEVVKVERAYERERVGIPSRNDGFGLVEIVVSMFLIGIIAVAFLPLLIQTMIVSANNATTAFATQVVNAELTDANSFDTCVEVAAFQAATIDPVEDSRGIELQPSRTISSCPAVLPGAIEFTSTVVRTDTGDPVADATTLIFVTG